MRFLPHTQDDRKEMLGSIGASHIDDLYENVPAECFPKNPINLPTTKGEIEVERIISAYAAQNHAAHNGAFFLGAGSYYHHIPASVDHIIQRSEFLTSYTPYQPEISQGTLQVIFEFQSMIAALTGQEIANASMYDGSTAVAEAMLIAKRITKKDNVKIHGKLHPHYFDTLKTYLDRFDGKIISDELDENCACLIVQTPDFYGNIHELEDLRKACDEKGALLVVVINEIVSLGLLPPPTLADIVVGEAQSIGNAMMFGGPYLGFFACSSKHVRQMPGRLCGQTVDADGKRSFVLTLNTREQHIRREKATSNICTNQGLCATAFTIHLSLLGEEGFKNLARTNHNNACKLADRLAQIKGVKILNDNFFNEFLMEINGDAEQIINNLVEHKIIGGLAIENNKILVAATEMTSAEDIEKYAENLARELGALGSK